MTGVRTDIADVASDESLNAMSTTVGAATLTDKTNVSPAGNHRVMYRRLNGSRLHPFIFRRICCPNKLPIFWRPPNAEDIFADIVSVTRRISIGLKTLKDFTICSVRLFQDTIHTLSR